MQVLKMELRGFKSFADKTTLTFDKGITAIVGPNGSGKSNISDAVRWVMGEQNVRQLRGQKADDIIFAGTEKRRPQGAAEVSLYFDNHDHSLDTEFTEVVVTRRLFRSGESEFYINKRPCRLKDIRLLFADTGIGQDSMAVIGQNRVDRILNSKPEERRIIFEEVAGISRYKGRKEEGLRKIAETERNLERIRDMMALLKERLEPMAKEAEKLKTFRHLDSERISYEGTLTLQELRNYERLVAKVENSRLTALQERDTFAAAIADKERQRQAVVKQMEAEGQELRQLDEKAQHAHADLDSLNSRSQACRQRQEELQRRAVELGQEKETLTATIQKQEGQIGSLEDQVSQKEKAWEAAKQGLALSENLFHEAEQKAIAAGETLQQVTAAQTKLRQDRLLCEHDIAELRRRLQENTAQGEEHKARIAQYETKRQDAQDAVRTTRDAVAQATKALEEQRRLTQAARQQLETAAKTMQTAAQTYSEARDKSAALQQRIRVLASMEEEHEGLGRAAKVVLEAKNQPWTSDICGVVGSLCTIPAPLTTAVDVALGGASRYIVTQTEQSAKGAIAYLKERRAGRTTFLPLNTIRPRRRTDEEERAVREAGSLGFANELIQFDAVYGAIFSSLLGKTILVENSAAGSRIAKAYGHRLRLVSLDGTIFNPGGSLTGGSVQRPESSVISRRALLEELKRQWQTAQEAVTAATAMGTEQRRIAQDLETQCKAYEEDLRQRELTHTQAVFQAEQADQTWRQLEEAGQEGARKQEEWQRLRADIQAELVRKEEQLTGLTQSPAQDTTSMEHARLAAQGEVERCRKAWTEQEVQVATLQEQVRHSKEQLAQYKAWQQTSKDDAARLAKQEQQLARETKETVLLLQKLTKTIAAKEEEVRQCDAAKDRFYEAKEANFAASKALDEAIADLREHVETWRQRLNTADVQLEKYTAEVRRSEERLALQGLTRQEAMERRRDGSLKELQEHVALLRQQITGLGSINPNAEVEYQGAVEKEQFYEGQCQDLLESRTKLSAIVTEIDAAMAAQFGKAFQEIRGHFQQIFSRLFGGGTAHIILTDTKDMLHSGVEIVIQPPGKKQQPLPLLSGGERALTVIALLLAFLAYHPAPFCLVDEVDAALDEANVERMARYLKNYSGHTQFIVITHRRKTMEAANTLQGVTMEEKGVSRLITVKVDDVLEKGR